MKIRKSKKEIRSRKSQYGIYIVESLNSNDYPDGKNLCEILRLSLIPTAYKWVDSREELLNALQDFKELGYRYLHLSFHGDKNSISINGDSISNENIHEHFEEYIESKRVFLASCQGGSRYIAGPMIQKCGAISVTGCPIELSFDKSAIFWPAFYHIMYEADKKRMSRALLQEKLKKCVDLLSTNINYYGKTRFKNKIRRLKFTPDTRTDNRLLNI